MALSPSASSSWMDSFGIDPVVLVGIVIIVVGSLVIAIRGGKTTR